MQQGEKLKALLEQSEQQLDKLQAGVPGLSRAHSQPAARVGPGRRVGRGQPRGAPLGRAAQVRFRGQGPRRRRRRARRHRLRDRGQDRRRRFVVMKGEVARLHRALAQFMLDVHTREHGYTEVYAPYMVSGACANGVSSLAKFKDDLFKIEGARPVPHSRPPSTRSPTSCATRSCRPRSCRSSSPATRRASAPRRARPARTRAA